MAWRNCRAWFSPGHSTWQPLKRGEGQPRRAETSEEAAEQPLVPGHWLFCLKLIRALQLGTIPASQHGAHAAVPPAKRPGMELSIWVIPLKCRAALCLGALSAGRTGAPHRALVQAGLSTAVVLGELCNLILVRVKIVKSLHLFWVWHIPSMSYYTATMITLSHFFP